MARDFAEACESSGLDPADITAMAAKRLVKTPEGRHQKVRRLIDRVRGDARPLDVQEIDACIHALQDVREYMVSDFTIQALIAQASKDTLEELSSTLSLECGGKQGQSRLVGAMGALMNGFSSLGDAKGVVESIHGHLHSKFMVAFATEYNVTDGGDDARLSHKDFKNAVDGAIKMKTMAASREQEEVLRQELARRTHEMTVEMEKKAREMAAQMAEAMVQQRLAEQTLERADEDML